MLRAAGAPCPPRAAPSTRTQHVMDNSTAVGTPPAEAQAVEVPTLAMGGITKHFDGVAALNDVAFDVMPGEVHALLGENGAGKSTLMNIASGATEPDTGSIVFEGESVIGLTPAAAQDLGIAMVHQHPALLPDMTVAENIQLAVGADHLRSRNEDVSKAMRALLDDVHFNGDLEDRVSSLTVARRHLLELAKALAVSPRLLILDEPTAPLTQDSVELLFDAVRKLARRRHGRRLHHPPPRRGARDRRPGNSPARRHPARHISRQQHLRLGPARDDRRPRARGVVPAEDSGEASEALLQVEGLSGQGFENISLIAHPGEIVGDRRDRRQRADSIPSRASPDVTITPPEPSASAAGCSRVGACSKVPRTCRPTG